MTMCEHDQNSYSFSSASLARDFWLKTLHDKILPFWRDAIDHKYGGVFTCFSNDGEQLVSKNKYLWSQGRFLWLVCRQLEMMDRGVLSSGHKNLYLETAQKSMEFLAEYAFLDNGNCYFLVDQKGVPLEDIPGNGYDTSFFADCFVSLGLSEYARYFSCPDTLKLSSCCYWNIIRRTDSGDYRSEPYPKPDGFDIHSYSMILLNTSCNLFEALKVSNTSEHEREKLRKSIIKHYDTILNIFYQPKLTSSHRIIEAFPVDEKDRDSMLFRHVNPGHMLECCWFLHEAMQILDRDDIVLLKEVAKTAWRLGWDDEYGGLLRFVDADRKTRPCGRNTGSVFEKMMLQTWDTKLWWPHSEGLYTLLLMYFKTDDSRFLTMHETIANYCLTVFPHPQNKEWIQIRDRTGQPLNKVVALPVKDPFHIARSILLMIDLLDKKAKQND